MTISLSTEVKADITSFITDHLDIFTPMDCNGQCECGNANNPDDCECLTMQLTIACNENGTEWNYQTGDNSYTGGAYGLPHWAVTWVSHDCDKADIVTDVIDQLNNLIDS